MKGFNPWSLWQSFNPWSLWARTRRARRVALRVLGIVTVGLLYFALIALLFLIG